MVSFGYFPQHRPCFIESQLELCLCSADHVATMRAAHGVKVPLVDERLEPCSELLRRLWRGVQPGSFDGRVKREAVGRDADEAEEEAHVLAVEVDGVVDVQHARLPAVHPDAGEVVEVLRQRRCELGALRDPHLHLGGPVGEVLAHVPRPGHVGERAEVARGAEVAEARVLRVERDEGEGVELSLIHI